MSHRFYVTQDVRIVRRGHKIEGIVESVSNTSCQVALYGPYGEASADVLTVNFVDLTPLTSEGHAPLEFHEYYEGILKEESEDPGYHKLALLELLEEMCRGFRIPDFPTPEWEADNRDIVSLYRIIWRTVERIP